MPASGTVTSVLPTFQFHKGAIRTRHCFKMKAWVTHFNSIKVRLELNLKNLTHTDKSLFQFHKGAIRTYLLHCLADARS